MDKPLDWGKKMIASLSPRKKTSEVSPRADEPITTAISPLKKEPPLQQEELSPGTQNPTNQDCIVLSRLATEIDTLYRTSKEVITRERVENTYIKALKCFVQTYEENKKETRLHLKKLHILFLEIQNEKKQENPIYQMPVQIAQLNTKVYDLIKSYINEGNHE